MTAPPCFDDAFLAGLRELMNWRRDVRRFKREPVPRPLIDEMLGLAQLSPSVGNSQPWRLVEVASEPMRAAVKANFRACNAAALAAQAPSRADDYARLKLEGLDAAPTQFAVFCDRGTQQGHGLGALTMPETLDYSVVSMIAMLWLAARARGLGLGWVSILDPARMVADLGLPASYKFIAYLCLGFPEGEHDTPELERAGWQARTPIGAYILHV
ncbi:MAG: 5,6-dimethylbenzimidazole synthase [Pseudomonadota bacterium]|nr:5,6-dimethylbenzimidazole synthase [Pseudomonadota bacterium]